MAEFGYGRRLDAFRPLEESLVGVPMWLGARVEARLWRVGTR